MSRTVSRTIVWKSIYVDVVISPSTRTSPVVVAVSQATRAWGSSLMIASRMASDTWSHILSGWPSVTDSDVNRYCEASTMLIPLPVKTPGGGYHGASAGRGTGARLARMTQPLTRTLDPAPLDAADPLASFRGRFMVDDADLIYLDGNSLGRLPRATVERLDRVVRDEWGVELIRGWDHWLDEPERVGDLLATAILGAKPGEVVVSDSTTVNFYKLALAALDARPKRGVVITDRANFPTDRYVLEGLARQRGLTIDWLESDPVEGPLPVDVSAALARHPDDVALVTLSHVNYRSAAIADMAAITALAHDAGALALWDLSHSAGAIEVDLEGCSVDLAVGCSYKYLNGGPGSPAWLYVRSERQAELRNPNQGWFGQSDQIAMGQGYDP